MASLLSGDKMKLLFTAVSLLHFLAPVIGKSEKTYTFGEDCAVTLKHIDEEKTITLLYNGRGDINSWCEDMSFIGRDDGYLNEYEICITPEVYEDPDCAVELTYRESYDGTPLKNYTCNDKPTTKYCGEQDEYMFIYLKHIKSRNKENVQVKLKVEAVLTYNYYATIGIIIGSVAGGILVICVVIGVILCITCRGRRSPGQVMNPGTGVGMGQFQSPNASQPAGNYAPPLTGSYPTQPTGSQPTQQTGNGHTPSAPGFDGYTYNAPPPAYNTVSKM
ncbi:Hypothetical predicted protein [Mytilus galloprovincialis]|uniref:Uncharacterized protein n=1 Tax=Mytilus galloprovincialis TaxID=29158 RepID=A0A8B6CUD7_MYTGA|nr:Hypothetical predicted protein [Mytilus galloprovincialis]